jgi:hypothetical protein
MVFALAGDSTISKFLAIVKLLLNHIGQTNGPVTTMIFRDAKTAKPALKRAYPFLLMNLIG